MLCFLVPVIWSEPRMSKLVLNVKYLLFLSFLTTAEFYNLGHVQGIIRVHYLTRDNFYWFVLLSDLLFISAEKNQNKHLVRHIMLCPNDMNQTQFTKLLFLMIYLYPIAVVPKEDENIKMVKELKANQLLERKLEKLKKHKNADDDLDDNLKQFLLKHQESSDSLPSN